MLLDNKPTLDEMDEPFCKVARKRIETVPVAIADLLYASFAKSISSEFDASEKDLDEVIHTKGISVFVAEDLSTATSEDASTARIEDVISNSVIAITNLSKDKVFEARGAFISLFNIDQSQEKLSLQTDFEARKLFREFKDTRPFVKIIAAEGDNNENPKVRALIAGLPLPTRILEIMRIARDSRKRVIMVEKSLEQEALPLNLDKVEALEKQLKL